MKKIYTVLAAALFIFSSVYSQQSISYANSGVLIKHDGSIQMNVIGNPVRNVITLQISNPVSTKYELSLFTENGQKVTTMLYDHPAGISTKQIYVSSLPHGFYFLVATTNTGRQSLKLFIE